MTNGNLLLIVALTPVVIVLLVVLGSIALVLATLSPILGLLWMIHKRSLGGVKDRAAATCSSPKPSRKKRYPSWFTEAVTDLNDAGTK